MRLEPLNAGWCVARYIMTPRGRAALMALPFGALAAALYVLGTWVLLQPMEMRGMVH